MTSFDEIARTPGAGTAVANAVGRAFASFASAMRRRAQIARAERRLRQMPDHMLKDIGLSRSEIPGIIRFGRVEYGG